MALRLRNKWNYKGNERWRWDAFLDRTFGSNRRLIEFVQRGVGYSLAAPPTAVGW